MYISIVLIGVLFLSIGAFLIDAFGSTIGPLDASSLLLFLAYGLIPLVVVVMGILLSLAYSRVD
jgi:hypothetical protein